MQDIHMEVGETIMVTVKQVNGADITYRLETPSWGQDDGAGGNLLITCVKAELGENDAICVVGSDTQPDPEFGEGRPNGLFYNEDGSRVVGITANFIRLAYATQ